MRATVSETTAEIAIALIDREIFADPLQALPELPESHLKKAYNVKILHPCCARLVSCMIFAYLNSSLNGLTDLSQRTVEMKINANEEIKKSIHPQANRKEPSSQQMDFEALLKAEINNAAKIHQTTESSIPVDAASPVQINASAADAPVSAVDRLENLLDLLEDYRTKLADPNVKLKDIHPLVSILGREKEQLSPLLASLSADENLKNILNHTLVTVSLEIMKYNRGDYITT